MPKQVPVCTKKWKGERKEAFYFDAATSANDVTITPDGATTFPFMEPAPFAVPARQKFLRHLIDERGTFTYYAEPCPDLGKRKTHRKPHPLGNPRSVVIS